MTGITLKGKGDLQSYSLSLICLAISFVLIIFGDIVKQGVLDGLSFSVKTIIPTLFPFFILSDIWADVFVISQNGIVSKCFQKAFHLNKVSITAFILGLICGFPVGVKTAAQLYKDKRITKEELSHICGFANNPSAAFVISGVGAAILGNIFTGIRLYIAVIISAIIVGIIFRQKDMSLADSDVISRQSFSLVESIKNAALSSLNVMAYIVFFSALTSLVSVITNNSFVTTIFSVFFEVGNAVNSISKIENIDKPLCLSLIGFALGFSGLSVHLQAFSFLPREVSKKRYLFMKLIQAVICALLILLTEVIIQ